MRKSIILSGLFAVLLVTQTYALDAANTSWLENFDSAKKAAAEKKQIIFAYFWFNG